MLELFASFCLNLIFIGIPSYVCYQLGINTGIQRGVRRQIFKEWHLNGTIDIGKAHSSPESIRDSLHTSNEK